MIVGVSPCHLQLRTGVAVLIPTYEAGSFFRLIEARRGDSTAKVFVVSFVALGNAPMMCATMVAAVTSSPDTLTISAHAVEG
jgi:hypothetical protein